MTVFRGIMIVILLATISGTSFGKKKIRNNRTGNLQTDMRFSDLEVRGKYRIDTEAMIKAESDKSIFDILPPRQHFRDRLQNELEWE